MFIDCNGDYVPKQSSVPAFRRNRDALLICRVLNGTEDTSPSSLNLEHSSFEEKVQSWYLTPVLQVGDKMSSQSGPKSEDRREFNILSYRDTRAFLHHSQSTG